MSTHILMVVSNPSTSTTVGGPVGFWASELVHPYDAFVQRGYDVTVASPDGGRVELDALSDPNDASGYSVSDTLSKTYLDRPDFRALLADTPALAGLALEDYDAVVICGGQAPMFTFQAATDVHAAIRQFYDADKPTAALCHGTSALLYVRNDDGTPFLEGKTITGFANAEEDQADAIVGQTVMPFRIEDEAVKQGATFETADPWAPFAVHDRHLITGQQQNSGAETARLVIAALEG
ncbi:type 1 glutamine amidotransferase domain-containing protein [Rubrivirga sp.]|uniref:type 1 glutamine amidotransferase domain-containing protein n=1 Tax=Rubrivirga sp. TaxID=1885344 RepID=UPI003C71D6CD